MAYVVSWINDLHSEIMGAVHQISTFVQILRPKPEWKNVTLKIWTKIYKVCFISKEFYIRSSDEVWHLHLTIRPSYRAAEVHPKQNFWPSMKNMFHEERGYADVMFDWYQLKIGLMIEKKIGWTKLRKNYHWQARSTIPPLFLFCKKKDLKQCMFILPKKNLILDSDTLRQWTCSRIDYKMDLDLDSSLSTIWQNEQRFLKNFSTNPIQKYENLFKSNSWIPWLKDHKIWLVFSNSIAKLNN